MMCYWKPRIWPGYSRTIKSWLTNHRNWTLTPYCNNTQESSISLLEALVTLVCDVKQSDYVHTHAHTHIHTKHTQVYPWSRKWQPTPIFLLENPVGRGAWRTTDGVTKRQTQLSVCTNTHTHTHTHTYYQLASIASCSHSEENMEYGK